MAIQKAIIVLALASLQGEAAQTCQQTEACHDESDDVSLLAMATTKVGIQQHKAFDSQLRIFRLKFPMIDSELSLLAEGKGSRSSHMQWGLRLAVDMKTNIRSSLRQEDRKMETAINLQHFYGMAFPGGAGSGIAQSLLEEGRKVGNAKVEHHNDGEDENGCPLHCFSADQVQNGNYMCDGVNPCTNPEGVMEQSACELISDAALSQLHDLYIVESSEDEASQKLAVAQISEMAKRIGEKSTIAVPLDMHEAVLAALEGHVAKKKVTRRWSAQVNSLPQASINQMSNVGGISHAQ